MNSYFPIDYPFDVSYKEECITVCKPIKYENKYKEKVESKNNIDLSKLRESQEKNVLLSSNENDKYYGYNNRESLNDNELINDNSSNRPLLPKLTQLSKENDELNLNEINDVSSNNIKKILNSLDKNKIKKPEDLLNSPQFLKLSELSKNENENKNKNKNKNKDLEYLQLGIPLFNKILTYLSKKPNDIILKYLVEDFTTYTKPTEENINNLKIVIDEIDAKGYDNLFNRILDAMKELDVKGYDNEKNIRDINDDYNMNNGKITKLKYNLVEGFNECDMDKFDDKLLKMMFIVCILLLAYYFYNMICNKRR